MVVYIYQQKNKTLLKIILRIKSAIKKPTNFIKNNIK